MELGEPKRTWEVEPIETDAPAPVETPAPTETPELVPA